MRYSMLRYLCRLHAALLVTGMVCLMSVAGTAEAGEVADAVVSPTVVVWQPKMEYEALTLRVSIPGGKVVQEEFEAGETVTFPWGGNSLPDGLYTCELQVIPSPEGLTQTDYVTVQDGSFVDPTVTE